MMVGAAVLFAWPSAAQEPADPRAAQPERPTVATHAHTVAPGYLEIETGVQQTAAQGGGGEVDVPSLFKVGVTSHLQADLFAGLSAIRSRYGSASIGVSDLAVGVKWRLLDRNRFLGDFALEPTVKLPTGSIGSGTGTGTTDVGLLLISSYDRGPAALDVNVGYTRRSGSGAVVPTTATLWTVSLGLDVRDWLGWAAEVFGYPRTAGPAGQRGTAAVLLGPTFTIRRYLVADVGGVVGLAGDQPGMLYAGLTWNVGRLPGVRRPAASRR
jgi:hypothetical protein